MSTPSAGEAERLAALHALHILDTDPEAHFDAVCRTAQRLFGVATAYVSLIDAERQWLKACTGSMNLPAERSRNSSICTHTIMQDGVLVIPDIRLDPRFADGDLGEGASRIGFYAGVPLSLDPGLRVGSFCLVDPCPRAFSAEDEAALRDLAATVTAHLRLHRDNVALVREAELRRRHEGTIRAQRLEMEQRAASNVLLGMAEEMAQVGHWRINFADPYPSYSDSFLSIAGLDPAAAPAPFVDLVHPDDRPGVEAVLAAAVAGGHDFEFEARLVRPDGSLRDGMVRGACKRDNGRTTGLFGILMDTTERRRIQAEIHRSELRYRSLADALPLLVWTVDPGNGEATYANARFESYYGPIGPARAERVARNHPDDAPLLDAAWRSARATGKGYDGQWRLRSQDGSYRWHKLSMTPVQHPTDPGAVIEWIGTALDVDEIVTARLAEEDASRLLGIALEGAGAGTFDWDMRTGVTMLSSESLRLYGLPDAGEARGMTTAEWTATVNPDDVIETWDRIHRAIDGRTRYAAEFRVGPRWIYACGRTLYDGNGRPYRMIGLHLDITERKAAEAALRAVSDEAQAARAEAERASAAKSEFLAVMSHEIRTPLNSILGYADLLLERSGRDPEDRRRLELIRVSGEALLTVVNDVLDVSKIEAGRLELDPVDFSVRALLDDTVAIMRGGALKSDLAVEARIDPRLPEALRGDADRLRQVLFNLLNNAVKFTPAGSVTLTVRTEGPVRLPSGEAAEALRFEVADTGIGIAEAQRDRLFKRFSQVDGSISRRFGGSGLGLAICRDLVTLMGGSIGVESREGVGSTFWFTLSLPLAPPRAEAAPAPERPATPAPAKRGARLLLAEDVILNQELARAVLEAQDYRVDIVGDGAEAIAAVQSQGDDPYALVLMDVQMPGMDGLTATRRIRALPGPAARVPIVAMTANVLDQQIRELIEAGMDDHVGKPFKRAHLYAVVERWRGQGAARRAGGITAPAPAVPILDHETYATVRDMMGRERILALLSLLESELDLRFASAAAQAEADLDRAQLAYDAHAMVAAAGVLGFVGISSLCREIETACRNGGDVLPLIRSFSALRRDTLGTIRALRAA
ncbi:signal transduction histidine kinase/DNA-binding response OmpR family regulator [Methylorubrum rhodinum]|uniref:histidine kinase n=1 Tax=Methylorubrum rhodinum TaxID=29428 RepID=A0A840ZF52_9HYPH|nr:ATP-binding protein [Methylorubrum rhodinum]MBB5755808.1 signal transduction histidine kinase/DNA-binding response OmpR family regulator [Methylorubrum rhodinum]